MNSKNKKKTRRQDKIIRLVETCGYARLSDLAKKLNTSEQTIRRDIFELDNAGKVQRTHGGVAIGTRLNAPVYIQRRFSQAVEKRGIARKVADIIPDGSSLFLDTGTTCEAVADALLIRKNLKIVTYSIRSANHFNYREDFTVAIPGGIVRHVDGSIISTKADKFIEQFRFDYAIVSVTGFSNNGELGDDDSFEVTNVRAAMNNAKNIILALGSEKFGKSSLIALCNVKEVDTIVTDSSPSKYICELAHKNKVNVIVSSAGDE